MAHKPRMILFGTPEFAAISFRALIESNEYDIPLIVSQPDSPTGRGLKIINSPVKNLAIEKNIQILQPPSLKGKTEASQHFLDFIRSQTPVELFVVIAYGKIIPKYLLDLPSVCALNVHGSILPRWRGAAPIHRAIAAGDKMTGVGIMRLEEGLDTGPIFSECTTSITQEDNFLTLHDRLANLGRELLLDSIPRILSGMLTPTKQSSEGISYADKWGKEELQIDWSDTAETTTNRIRASSPSPGARTTLSGSLVKIFKGELAASSGSGAPVGSIVEINESGAIVQLKGDERFLIRELQLSGKKKLPAVDVAKGRGIKVGDLFE